MKMWCFSKRNYVNICLFHNVFRQDLWLPVTKGPPVTSFARSRNSRWQMFRTLKRFFNVKMGLSEQKIYRFRRCHVCTKQLCGPQNSIFGIYMPIKQVNAASNHVDRCPPDNLGIFVVQFRKFNKRFQQSFLLVRVIEWITRQNEEHYKTFLLLEDLRYCTTCRVSFCK